MKRAIYNAPTGEDVPVEIVSYDDIRRTYVVRVLNDVKSEMPGLSGHHRKGDTFTSTSLRITAIREE